MRFVVHQHDFAVEDFCRLNQANFLAAHSPFANCRFNVDLEATSRIKAELTGPGIYAICYDQQLIYIGKYLGLKENAFAGNVARLRWVQHLGSMTMRDRRVSLSKRSLDVLLDPNFAHRRHPLIGSLVHAFDHERVSGSTKPFLQRDRGCLSTINRILFAIEHWPLFSQALGPALGGFSFHYFQVEKPCSEIPVKELRSLISALEDRLVEAFRPRCNAVIDPGTALSWERSKALNELWGELRHFLSAEVSPYTHEQPITKIANGTRIFESSSQFAEPEEMSTEVMFFERLEGAPTEATALLHDLRLYAAEKDDVELHFTRASGGDVRLRKHGLGKDKRRSQNFLTLTWQTRDKKFRINNICQPPANNMSAGLYKFVVPLSHDPLKSTLKVDAQTIYAERKAFMEWVESGRMECR